MCRLVVFESGRPHRTKGREWNASAARFPSRSDLTSSMDSTRRCFWRDKLRSMPFSCAILHTTPLMCSTELTGTRLGVRTGPSESDSCAKSCAISAEQAVMRGC